MTGPGQDQNSTFSTFIKYKIVAYSCPLYKKKSHLYVRVGYSYVCLFPAVSQE
jgi:hypothetical protein